MSYIHPTAIIGDNVQLGDNVYIGPYCLVGLMGENKSTWGEESKGVIIGAGTVLTGHVTIDGGCYEPTIVGSNCFLMKHSHVGHDAALHDEVTISCGAKVGGHSIIGKYCNIGLNAVIHQKVEIPKGCMVGMGAVYTKSIKASPFEIYAGNPARYLKMNNYLIDKLPHNELW